MEDPQPLLDLLFYAVEFRCFGSNKAGFNIFQSINIRLQSERRIVSVCLTKHRAPFVGAEWFLLPPLFKLVSGVLADFLRDLLVFGAAHHQLGLHSAGIDQPIHNGECFCDITANR